MAIISRYKLKTGEEVDYFPPIQNTANPYTTEAAMHADQANQLEGYGYLVDGLGAFTYLGTVAGTAADYEGFGKKYGTRAVLAAAEIDWADGVDVYTKELTEALVLTEINLPQGSNVFIKKLIANNNFPVTMPGAHYVWKGGVAGGVSDAYVFDCINGNAGSLRIEYTITPNA